MDNTYVWKKSVYTFVYWKKNKKKLQRTMINCTAGMIKLQVNILILVLFYSFRKQCAYSFVLYLHTYILYHNELIYLFHRTTCLRLGL